MNERAAGLARYWSGGPLWSEAASRARRTPPRRYCNPLHSNPAARPTILHSTPLVPSYHRANGAAPNPVPPPAPAARSRHRRRSTRDSMSYMRGDLLTKTRKLVKGLAIPAPRWLKAMEEAPPVVFPRTNGKIKIKNIEMPEDVYVRRFFKKHPDSLYHDAVKISGFNPPPARVFAWRVLELKEQGVSEDEAVAVADMEYRAEKKAKKKAYKELKEIARSQGKRPPPNPYPSAIQEIQAEEKKYVDARWNDPKIIEIANKMKEERELMFQDRAPASGRP